MKLLLRILLGPPLAVLDGDLAALGAAGENGIVELVMASLAGDLSPSVVRSLCWTLSDRQESGV